MIARTLFPTRVGCATACACKAVCDNADGCSNIAYPELVLNVLPTGLTGLLLAVMMAALMSSLASTFNSAGTMFTIDVWNALKPHSTQRQQVIVGYIVVAVMVGISVAWLPVLEALQGDQLFLYLQVRIFRVFCLLCFASSSFLAVVIIWLFRMCMQDSMINSSTGCGSYGRNLEETSQCCIVEWVSLLISLPIKILFLDGMQSVVFNGSIFVYKLCAWLLCAVLSLQAISSYAQPPLSAVFLLGAFWTRATRRGAYAGLGLGLTIGATRFILESVYNSISDTSKCAVDTRPWVVRVHFIYVGFFELIVSGATTIIVSYLTTPVPRAQLAGLTWWTKNDSKEYKIAADNPSDRSAAKSSESSLLVRNHGDTDQQETSFGSGATSDTDQSTSEMPGEHADEHALDSDHTEDSAERVCGIPFSPLGLKWFLRSAVVIQLGVLLAVWIVFR